MLNDTQAQRKKVAMLFGGLACLALVLYFFVGGFTAESAPRHSRHTKTVEEKEPEIKKPPKTYPKPTPEPETEEPGGTGADGYTLFCINSKVQRKSEAPEKCPWNIERVMQTSEETKLVERNLKPSYRVLEWGSGGSTIIYSPKVSQYFSIEHNPEWYSNVQCNLQRLATKEKIEVCTLRTPYEWDGREDGTKEGFKEYIEGVSQFNITSFDAVFVDGRARVFCAKEAMRYGPQSLLFVHDFERAAYKPILKWFDMVEQAGRMAMLCKKESP